MAVFDPTSERFASDPYPAYAALRRGGGLHWDEGTGMYLAASHAAASAVLRDRGLGRIWRDREPARRLRAFNLIHRGALLETEPPEHTRLRRLVAAGFARVEVERLRPRVLDLAESLADRLADRAGADGEVDLVATYAEPLPVAVIAELLGVAEADRPLLRPWSNAIVRMYEYGLRPEVQRRAERAAAEFAAYLRGLAAQRRSRPGRDLVSALCAQQTSGDDRISEDELVATCILLLNAGHEASVNVIGNGMLALLRDPAELDRLRADPALVPIAVEELIRYDSPLHLFERTAREDVRIGAVTVAAGQKVAALLGAANRDPAVFADPDRLDVTRHPNPHLGFGAGIHFCLGAALARLELRVALGVLLRRFPGMALAAEPRRRPGFVIRGLRELRVRL